MDFLNNRSYHQEAAQLVDMCVHEKVTGFICAHELSTLSYFLLKEQKDKAKVINTLSSLLDIFTIIPIDEDILRASLLSKRISTLLFRETFLILRYQES